MNDPETETGARLGRFDILALLGRGGMGEVYLAAHRGPSAFAKLVVLKILRTELLTDDTMLAMFEDEARVSAQLTHPNIAQTLELCVDDSKPYLVMEYLDGQPLSTIFRRLSKHKETMPPRILVRIVLDILGALEYAHSFTDLSGAPMHLVHRDVSPQNVFVTYAGQAKLLDFGIAKVALGAENTKTGVLKGKVAFMAPEQAVGVKVDCRADIFSLGMVLLQGLSGKKPWGPTEDMQILLALAAGKVPSPAELTDEVPRALVTICARALAANRDDRYSSAREMRADLDAFLASYKDAGESPNLTEFMEGLFADERAEKKTLIETKLKDLMDGTPQGPLSSGRLKLRNTTTDGTSRTPTPSARSSVRPPADEGRRSGRFAIVAVMAVALGAAIWFMKPRAKDSPAPVQSTPAAANTVDPPPPISAVSATATEVQRPPLPAASFSAPSEPSAIPAVPTVRSPRHIASQTVPTAKRPPTAAAPSSGSGAFDLGSQE
jgi:serine/threonine-protein kinase